MPLMFEKAVEKLNSSPCLQGPQALEWFYDCLKYVPSSSNFSSAFLIDFPHVGKDKGQFTQNATDEVL